MGEASVREGTIAGLESRLSTTLEQHKKEMDVLQETYETQIESMKSDLEAIRCDSDENFGEYQKTVVDLKERISTLEKERDDLEAEKDLLSRSFKDLVEKAFIEFIEHFKSSQQDVDTKAEHLQADVNRLSTLMKTVKESVDFEVEDPATNPPSTDPNLSTDLQLMEEARTSNAPGLAMKVATSKGPVYDTSTRGQEVGSLQVSYKEDDSLSSIAGLSVTSAGESRMR